VRAAAGEQYPNLAEARRHVVEVRQGASDALFVPSGWHHTVENLEGCSLNLLLTYTSW
jgi:oxalate decarboxylase/phosphoglucose isomerase-like protein (cupin superfamily)